MAQTTLTASEAHVLALLSRSDRWAKAVRNQDGLVYTLFAGSTGKTYWTTETTCSCPGFEWRRTCAHRDAVRIRGERARAKAFRRPKATYDDLHPETDYVF